MKPNLLLIALLSFGCISARQANVNHQQPGSVQPGKSSLVKRNRNAEITFDKDQVYQDNKVIGGMQMTQGTEKGQIVKTFSVFYLDGFKIADAKCYGMNSHEWHITTLKDKRTHVLTSGNNQDAIDVIKYLIKGNYL